MRILVLGSEGFIGSNAVRYFEAKGYTVFKADIIIKEEPGYTIINPEHSDFTSLFLGKQLDACINATGSANVQFSFTNPALDYSLNVANVYLLLDAIRRYGEGCKFINLSSAAVYGNPSVLPISEEVSCAPLSPYGLHKLYSEHICKEFTDHFAVPTICLRIFSAYGEGLKKQLFWDLYKKLSAPVKSVQLFGTGDESRDFIYIGDLVRALESILLHANFNGKAINVASGRETRISEVVQLFKTLLNSEIEIRFSGENKIGDPVNWRADISMLASLGFNATTEIDTGLKNYIEWVKGKE